MQCAKQKKQKVLNKTDKKVIDILQKETKTLTLQEIANKTGETPQKIAKSICKVFVHNKNLINEKFLQINL